jgi:hypothetical protein
VAPPPGRFRRLLSSAEARWGGPEPEVSHPELEDGKPLGLPPWSAVVLERLDPGAG